MLEGLFLPPPCFGSRPSTLFPFFGSHFLGSGGTALQAAQQIAQISNLFGYGEIKPLGSGYYGSSMIPFFSQLQMEHFQTVQIQLKEEIWPSFKSFLTKDRAREKAA